METGRAALKAARRLDPAVAETPADCQEVDPRERGTHTVHGSEAWAWDEATLDSGPDRFGETVTQAVATQRVNHRDEWPAHRT